MGNLIPPRDTCDDLSTCSASDLPDLPTSKITSGTFNPARMAHRMIGTLDMVGHPIDNLPTPVSGSEAANKAYVDASGGGGTAGMMDLYATLADHAYRGIFRSVQTVGQASGFGDVVYFKSDGKWWYTDADAEATTKGKLGIVLETIAADAAGEIGELCDVRDDSWSFGIGSVLYVSCTSGSMTTTQPTASGDQVRKVGVALAANKVAFKPDDTVIELV